MTLEVSGLSVSYGGIVAVRDVSLRVEPGEVHALLGANGAGKTSTLRAISGLVPARGAVRLDGASLLGRPPEAIAAAGVAHVPDNRGLFANLSVADNLRMGRYGVRRHTSAAGDEALENVLTLFPVLRERLRQPAGTLSGGQAQQLAIARALVAGPRVLLLDEMSMGLAPQIVADLFRIVADLRASGVAVLLVEQFVGDALRIADRVTVLEHGEVIVSGSPADLGGDELTTAYLGAHSHGAGAFPQAPADRAAEPVRISLAGRTIRDLERLAARRGTTVDALVGTAVNELLADRP